ncbi:MAG: hotdog fold thioesterase [Bacteroidota bacterium]
MIWKVKPTPEFVHSFPRKNMADHLGIDIVDVGDDYITARMPVDERTIQPFGLLHGGASCVLAETLGSIAGTFCIDPTKQMVVGIEINANHIRSAKSGYVYGTVKPIHIGLSTQVWNIEIVNEEKKLVCVSRLTCAVKNI